MEQIAQCLWSGKRWGGRTFLRDKTEKVGLGNKKQGVLRLG